MTDYTAFRARFSDPEHAARAAFQQAMDSRHQLEQAQRLRNDETEERLALADRYREQAEQLRQQQAHADHLRQLIEGGFDGAGFLACALIWAAANGYLRGYHAATGVYPDNGPAAAQAWLQELIASGHLADELARATYSSREAANVE